MKWLRLLLVVVLAVVASSFADWLISGVLLHDAYSQAPDIWRAGGDEGARIGLSMAVSVIGVVGFVLLVGRDGRPSPGGGLKTAMLAWLAGPVPVVLTDLVWIKMTPLIAGSTALEWLARFVIAALAAAWLL